LLIIVILVIIWSLLGYLDTPSHSIRFEIDPSTSSEPQIFDSLAISAIISYPFIASLGYFRYAISSEQDSLMIFQIALIAIFLIGLSLTLPSLLGNLLSKNQDKEIRNILLLIQAGYLAVIAVYLILIIWSSEIANDKIQVRFALILILSILLFSFLIPYFAGWQRSRRWRIYLIERELKWINQLLNILDFPSTHQYISKLKIVMCNINTEIENFIEKEKLLKVFAINENQEQLFDSKEREVQYTDSRLEYLTFLTLLRKGIFECIYEFESLKGDSDSNSFELAQGFSSAYRIRKDELISSLEREGQAKPLLWIGLTFIFTTILSQILGNFSSSLGTAIVYIGNFSSILAQAAVIRP
jgi:hypothetical protein